MTQITQGKQKGPKRVVLIKKSNKAEHAVQSYAAGIGGLGALGYGLYLQYADRMTELHCPYWRKRQEEKNQLTTNLR